MWLYLIKSGGFFQNPPRFLIGIPGAIRTRDLPLRRRMLYPAELRRHMGIDRMETPDRMHIADVFYRKKGSVSRGKSKAAPKRWRTLFSVLSHEIFRTISGQHRTMGAAGFGGSFAPIVQYEKWEIHKVFPHFPYFRLEQNPTPNLLAPLCGVALEAFSAENQAHVLWGRAYTVQYVVSAAAHL